MSNRNKIIIGIVLIIVIGIGYTYLKNSGQDQGATLTSETRTANYADAQTILTLLNQMSKIKLDNSIFFNQIFQSLKDTSVVLVSQPTGRDNPFAPIGTPSRVGTSASSASH